MQCVEWDKVKEWNLTEIDLTCFSDYSGGLVEKVNFDCIYKELKNYKYVYELTGYYGSRGIAYDNKKISKIAREKIEDIENSLESYPIYNDDIYFQTEWDMKQDYNTELLESMYEKEFAQFIEKSAFLEQCQKEGEIRDHFDNYCIIENLYAWIDEKKYTEVIKENLIKEVCRSLDYKAILCNGKLKIIHGFNECIVSYNTVDSTWDIQGIDIAMITPEFIEILKEFQV